ESDPKRESPIVFLLSINQVPLNEKMLSISCYLPNPSFGEMFLKVRVFLVI
ncbi:hypothetical protein BC941DRAFT_431547, partial [Chlamydoabsidia padenii]